MLRIIDLDSNFLKLCRDFGKVEEKCNRRQNEDGKLEHTYMLRPMGQKYKDVKDYPDDMEFLANLKAYF